MKLFIDCVILKDLSECQSYMKDLPIVKNLKKKHQLQFRKPVTFFVGENGTGKSTLLEAIAVSYGFNAEGGTKNFSFSTQDTHGELYEFLTIVKKNYPEDGFFLRAESFYNVATEIDSLDVAHRYGGKSLHAQSHGESFLSLIMHRFRANSLYILDEPEAALSPARQLTLLARLHDLVEEGAQFIIATHSPILLAYPDAEIFELTEEDMKVTPYKETEHFILTKMFLDHPERMLRHLFQDKDLSD